LDSHIRGRWISAGWGKAAVAFCALLCGLLLTFWSDEIGDFSVFAAGVAFLVFVFWGLQATIILSFAYQSELASAGHLAQEAGGSVNPQDLRAET
jgi:hypothetical protein